MYPAGSRTSCTLICARKGPCMTLHLASGIKLTKATTFLNLKHVSCNVFQD